MYRQLGYQQAPRALIGRGGGGNGRGRQLGKHGGYRGGHQPTEVASRLEVMVLRSTGTMFREATDSTSMFFQASRRPKHLMS